MSAIWTRRRVMQTVLAGSAGLSIGRLAFAQEIAATGTDAAKLPERSIELFNTHTNETVSVVYKRGAEFDPAALASLKNLLRDHRNGESHDMDPRLYDQLHDLALAAHREPHTQVAASRMIASVGSAITGSSRRSTRTSPGAYRMVPSMGFLPWMPVSGSRRPAGRCPSCAVAVWWFQVSALVAGVGGRVSRGYRFNPPAAGRAT